VQQIREPGVLHRGRAQNRPAHRLVANSRCFPVPGIRRGWHFRQGSHDGRKIIDILIRRSVGGFEPVFRHRRLGSRPSHPRKRMRAVRGRHATTRTKRADHARRTQPALHTRPSHPATPSCLTTPRWVSLRLSEQFVDPHSRTNHAISLPFTAAEPAVNSLSSASPVQMRPIAAGCGTPVPRRLPATPSCRRSAPSSRPRPSSADRWPTRGLSGVRRPSIPGDRSSSSSSSTFVRAVEIRAKFFVKRMLCVTLVSSPRQFLGHVARLRSTYQKALACTS
jgi:hypothetical protein